MAPQTLQDRAAEAIRHFAEDTSLSKDERLQGLYLLADYIDDLEMEIEDGDEDEDHDTDVEADRREGGFD